MSLVDRTITDVLQQQSNLHSYDNLDYIVESFNLGKSRVNDLNIDMFNFKVSSFQPKITPFNDKIFKQVTIDPKANIKPVPEKPISMFNYKVESMKPIKVENAFGSNIVKSDVQPLQHKNPQKYEYLLDKYDVQDIAMKRLDIEYGNENEYSKIFEDFYQNEYQKSLNEINIDVLNAYQPQNDDVGGPDEVSPSVPPVYETFTSVS